MAKKKSRALGAATDRPEQLIERAMRQYGEASKNDPHNVDARLASELGWLALNSFADVVGKRLGMPYGGGAAKRFDVLGTLDGRVPKLRSQDTFSAAREELHGMCYYEDKCPTKERTQTLLGNIKTVIDDGFKALDNPKTYKPRRPRRR